MEFETHRCLSPVVLFVVLLEDKQKSKQGEFDKCNISMGNLGLICDLYMYFSDYARFWLCCVLIAD